LRAGGRAGDLFLDEPTTGLDPQSRRQIWGWWLPTAPAAARCADYTLYGRGQRLCDRVAILDRGRLIRLGTPAELIAGLGAEHVVELELETGAGPGALDEATLRALPTVTEVHLSGEGVWALAAVEPDARCRRCARCCKSAGSTYCAGNTQGHAGRRVRFADRKGLAR